MVSSVPHCSAMKRALILQILLLAAAFQFALAIQAPTGVISLAGDQSVVLHWDRSTDASLAGYRVYRSTTGAGGPFCLLNTSLLTGPGYCDLSSKVINGQTNIYYATAVDTNSQESLPSATRGRAAASVCERRRVPRLRSAGVASITSGTARTRPMAWSRTAAPPGLGLQHRGGGIWADGHRHRG